MSTVKRDPHTEGRTAPSALVVIESMFGNTEAVGLAVAEGLRLEGVETETVTVNGASAQLPPGLGLLVVGAPTHAFSQPAQHTHGRRTPGSAGVGGRLGSPGVAGRRSRERPPSLHRRLRHSRDQGAVAAEGGWTDGQPHGAPPALHAPGAIRVIPGPRHQGTAGRRRAGAGRRLGPEPRHAAGRRHSGPGSQSDDVAETGTCQHTVVPLPAAELTENVPPCFSARSRMLLSPLSAISSPKPRPSSVTDRLT